MPAITTDPGILAAAREAIAIMLSFKGIPVALLPSKGVKIAKPGGGHDYGDPIPRLAQTFSVAKTNAFDGIEFSPNDEGEARKRAYILTGMWNAEIAIGDTWEDDEAEYKVDTVDQSSGFKTQAGVTGFLKVE